MKLLHVSDLHLGKRLDGFSLMDDQAFILERIVRIIKANNVDALLIAGDIYDKAQPGEEAVSLFDGFLTRVADLGVKILAIPGNHDSDERVAYAAGLLSARGVHLPPVYNGTVRKVTLVDSFGSVHFWLLPFLKSTDVKSKFPKAEISDYTTALDVALSSCEVDTSARNVILAHQYVTASGGTTSRAEEEIQLGGLDNVDASVFDAFDYVALGHVHRAQAVGRDTVRYSGSPLKYSMSEVHYDKSAVLVTIGEKTAGQSIGECVSWELVPLEPMRNLREITGKLEDILAAAEADECRNDFVRFTLLDEHPQLDALPKIREFYPNATGLDYQMTPQVVSQGSFTAIDPDTVSMADLFKAFFKEQMRRDMDEDQSKILATITAKVEEGGAR